MPAETSTVVASEVRLRTEMHIAVDRCGGGGSGLRRTARCLASLVFLFVAVPDLALAADPNKVLHVAFPVAETGFDPARVSDQYSNTINEVIFERLLTYDYLASPAKLVPMTAEAMPEVTDDGKTYTVRIRKGIYFTPDPAFKGAKRELVAQDYVYSYMRFLDPKNKAPYAFLLEGKIKGLDALAATAKKSGKFDYDAKLPDMEVLDRYTLRIRLAARDYNFPYVMAFAGYGAMAREVVEAYGNELDAHPVGTGPYMLAEWQRASKIVVVANPDYRGFTWDFKPNPGDKWDELTVAAMKGKQMPQIGRVEVSIIEEEQSRWLAFNNKELDYDNVPKEFIGKVLDAGNQLLPEWVNQLVTIYRAPDPEITYTALNVQDPLIGGFAREKIALRRAIILGYNLEEQIRIVRKNQAVRAEMPIPPGVVGHDPRYHSVNYYDPVLANKLLDAFGYRKGADGYRTLPDGKPLVLIYSTESSAVSRTFSELWKKSMDAIGLRLEVHISKFADNVKAAKQCQLMIWGAAWGADYPDGDNFMQLLYGPNIHQSNNGCYQSKAFDAFYVKSTQIPDSPERNRLFLEMSRQMEVDGAWSLNDTRMRNELIRPWVKGYKKHPIFNAEWPYLDIQP
jgi:ABC-type transport system substrate-binding protein